MHILIRKRSPEVSTDHGTKLIDRIILPVDRLLDGTPDPREAVDTQGVEQIVLLREVVVERCRANPHPWCDPACARTDIAFLVEERSRSRVSGSGPILVGVDVSC